MAMFKFANCKFWGYMVVLWNIYPLVIKIQQFAS